MSVFFLYTGLEVGAGQWEASFCRGHLNLSTGATGLATFGYWGALTAVPDLPGPRAPPGPAPHRGALRHRPGGDRGGGHLVAARPGRYRDRLRGPRRRPGRGLPGPDHLDPGAHRGAASPARHRLAGGRRRGRRRRSLRPDRPAHRRHQPGRPRPGADHPRGAGRRLRADPGPPRSSPGSPQPRPRSRPRSRGPQAVRRVRPGTASARSRTAVPTAQSTGPRHWELRGVPPRVLLHPVVAAALRSAVAHTCLRPPAS